MQIFSYFYTIVNGREFKHNVLYINYLDDDEKA
jgi:hypothetical protein